MAQIVRIDGDKRQVDKLTIIQLPYDYLPNETRQADISLSEIQEAISHIALNIDLEEALDFGLGYESDEEAREFLETYAVGRLAAKLNGVDYDAWLRDVAFPAITTRNMELVDEFKITD
jgi:hypothetical protein